VLRIQTWRSELITLQVLYSIKLKKKVSSYLTSTTPKNVSNVRRSYARKVKVTVQIRNEIKFSPRLLKIPQYQSSQKSVFTLKMEAAGTSETFVPYHNTTRRHYSDLHFIHTSVRIIDNQSPEDGRRDNARTAVCIKYTSSNEQWPTEVWRHFGIWKQQMHITRKLGLLIFHNTLF
jgi:hypothetical protein